MLPLPTINFIPKIYKDNSSSGIVALTDMLDDQFEEWRDSILNLARIKNTIECPEKFLCEMGYLFSAGVLKNDTDLTKRKKIANAIATHKLRGSWIDHAKIIIDAITGYDAEIYRNYNGDDWILTGDGIIETSTDWSILSGDGLDPYGMLLLGAGDESEIAGNIYIDCHVGIFTPVLTSDQINKIVNDIKDDIVPAYMRVYLSYIDVSGILTVYTNGTIG